MRARVALILLLLLCRGAVGQTGVVFSNGFEPAPEAEYSLAVSPNSILFTGPGETRQLAVEVVDRAGAPVSRTVSWRSTDPDVVSVSPQGEISALAAGGSAQIIVETEGAMPASALVVIAQPATGAMLVADAEVLSAPALVDPAAPYGLSSQYTVELALASAPAIGQVLLATGQARVGGRVVEVTAITGGYLVTLEVIPIAEMFDQLEIDQTLDLSTAPATIHPGLSASYDIVQRIDGSLEATLKPGAAKSGTSALFDIAGDCESGIPNLTNVLTIDVGPDLGIERQLGFHLGYGSDGLEELRVDGFVEGFFEVKPRLTTAFEGKVGCKLNIMNIAIPFGGPLSWIVSGVIPIGVGFELGGKVTFTEPIGYDVTASAKASFNTGIVCPAGVCDMVGELDTNVDGTLRPVFPATLEAILGSARFEASAYGFAYAEMGIGNPLLTSLSIKPIEVKAGLQQSLDLESMASQAGKNDYASGFKLELAASAGATNEIDGLLNLLQINSSLLTLETKLTLAQSPQGTLAINPASVAPAEGGAPGELATFEVAFTSVGYGVLDDYIVNGVEIRFAEDNGAGGVTLAPGRPGCNTLAATEGQTVFTCQTDFLAEHAGQRQFVAFARATLFGFELPIPLEIADDSTASLTVGDGANFIQYTSTVEVGMDRELVRGQECVSLEIQADEQPGVNEHARSVAGPGRLEVLADARYDGTPDPGFVIVRSRAGMRLRTAEKPSELTLAIDSTAVPAPHPTHGGIVGTGNLSIGVSADTRDPTNEGTPVATFGSVNFCEGCQDPISGSGVLENYTGGPALIPVGPIDLPDAPEYEIQISISAQARGFLIDASLEYPTYAGEGPPCEP